MKPIMLDIIHTPSIASFTIDRSFEKSQQLEPNNIHVLVFGEKYEIEFLGGAKLVSPLFQPATVAAINDENKK